MQVRNVLLVLAILLYGLSVSFFGQTASRQPSAPVSASLVPVENKATTTSSFAKPKEASKETPKVPTSTPTVPVNAKPLPPTKPASVSQPTSNPVKTSNPAGDAAFAKLDTTVGLLQRVTVNILCTSNTPGIRSTSGSGIFIGSQGLILTAAHVAEFLLLTDYTNAEGSCIIRAGSPAELAYKVKLAYISPSWVKKNAATLTESTPIGTGENDFAVLAITSDINGNGVGPHIAVSLSDEIPNVKEKVSIGSYGAEFLSGNQIRTALYPIIDFQTITQRYTFDVDTVDLISLGGGAASQEGSSGGGVLNEKNELIGLITTSSLNSTLTERHLNAITPGHIRDSFQKDMHEDFETHFRNHTPTDLVTFFEETARSLANIVTKAI